MRDYAGSLPVLLEADLYRAGWNGTINPYPCIDPKTYAMQSLRKSLLKKYQDQIKPSADAEALSLFLKNNENCRRFVMDTSSMNEVETIAIGEAKDFLYSFFYPDEESCERLLRMSSITDNFGLGNGANIGSYSTDFLSKVGTSRMSATNPALHMFYMQAISENSIWSDVESIRSVARGLDIVRGSRISFAPKTAEISRTICTEPLCNMLFQKGIGAVLEGRIKQTLGISLADQPNKNQTLARLGSKDGSFGTIDLSSASDSMSLSLVREMFPKHVSALLELTRSPVTTLPGGAEVELHMVSSMGNAFTFPLQTLLFSSLVYGAYKVKSIKLERPSRRSLGNFAVYGDDIIVVKEAYDLVVRLLGLCGFSVNVDKSFNEGLFRESCGHDYYDGHNVRGVYIKSLKDNGDRYSAINRLNVWSAKWGINLNATVSYLMSGLRLMPVPWHEMDTAGVKIPFRDLRRRPKQDRNTGAFIYRCLDFVPNAFSVLDVGTRPLKVRGWLYNPSAVLLAALAGTLRAVMLVIRAERRVTRLRWRSSSSWDCPLPNHGESRGFGERWKSFVELNLNLL